MSGMLPPGMVNKLLLDQIIAGRGPDQESSNNKSLSDIIIGGGNGDNESELIIQADPDGRVIDQNDSATRTLFNYLANKASGATNFIADKTEDATNYLKNVVKRNNEGTLFDYQTPSPTATVVPVVATAAAIPATKAAAAPAEVKPPENELDQFGGAVAYGKNIQPLPLAEAVPGGEGTAPTTRENKVENIIDSTISSINDDAREKKNAVKEYQKILDAEAAGIARNIKSVEQLEADQILFDERMAQKEADMQKIINGLNENANKKDHWGVVLGKAIAVGLGAYGAALSGTPNFAAQVIEAGADRASKELAMNADKSLKLMGYKKQEIEDFKERYDTGLKRQQAFKDALMKNQKDGLELIINNNSNNESQDRILKATGVLEKLNKGAESTAQASKGGGVVMKQVINMPQEFYDRLNTDQKRLVNEISQGATSSINSYNNIMEIIQNKDFMGLSGTDQRSKLQPMLNQMATNIRLAGGFGVLNPNDEKYVEQQASLVGALESALGRGKIEFASRLYSALTDGIAKVKGFDESFDYQPPIRKALEQLEMLMSGEELAQ